MKRDAAGLPVGDDERFLRLLSRLIHAVETRSKRMEAEIGVTFQQRTILRLVGRFPGMTAGQLAEVLHVDPGTISAALRRLEQRRLLERRRDARDLRRVLLGLTEHGRALDVVAGGTVERAVKETLAESSDESRRCTEEVIGRLIEALERSDVDAPRD